MQESIVFVVRVQCRKESSRSLSHLLMSFLFILSVAFRLSRCGSVDCETLMSGLLAGG